MKVFDEINIGDIIYLFYVNGTHIKFVKKKVIDINTFTPSQIELGYNGSFCSSVILPKKASCFCEPDSTILYATEVQALKEYIFKYFDDKIDKIIKQRDNLLKYVYNGPTNDREIRYK